MDRIEIEDAIITAVDSCADEDGWANLAELGNHLREMGIEYRKLSRFLEEYGTMLERRVDHSINPPVAYARVIEDLI